jgi:DNA-binding NarL/FixJ family response regulator
MDPVRPSHYLLVDDHSLIREGMMQAIRSLDPSARFSQANSLATALARIDDQAAEPIDVVLLDLGLPDSRGIATLQTMRQAAPTQRIGIITGHADVQIALECIHHGASCFIPKLAEIDGFTSALQALVEGRLHFPSELLSPSEVDFPTPDDETARRTIRLTRVAAQGLHQPRHRLGPGHQRRDGQAARQRHLPRLRRAQPHAAGFAVLAQPAGCQHAATG